MAKELHHKPLPVEYVYHNFPPPAVLWLHELSWHYLISKIQLAAIDKRLISDLRYSNGFMQRGRVISFCLTDGGHQKVHQGV